MTPATQPAVLAYDGSEPARAAAGRIPDLFPGRPVVVVSVWQSIASAAPAAAIGMPAGMATQASKAIAEQAEQAAAALAEEGTLLLAQAGVDASPSVITSDGSVWASIIAHAEEQDAAVIVVGSRGRSGIKSALLGSVSTGVAHHGSRPVLVVH